MGHSALGWGRSKLAGCVTRSFIRCLQNVLKFQHKVGSLGEQSAMPQELVLSQLQRPGKVSSAGVALQRCVDASLLFCSMQDWGGLPKRAGSRLGHCSSRKMWTNWGEPRGEQWK